MSFAKMPVLRRGLMVMHEDIYTEAVRADRIERIRGLFVKKGLQGIIMVSIPAACGAVCYCTNYPCYGAGRQTAFVLGETGEPLLYTSDPGRNVPKVRRFTFYDIQKGRQFVKGAIAGAKKIAPNGRFGLVGCSYMPVGAQEEIEAELGAENLIDLEDEYFAMIADADEAALTATRKAVSLADKGIAMLESAARSGKDLWQVAADADRSMRYEGCEGTNVLFGSGEGVVRPGLPLNTVPEADDTIVAYFGVQYARYWGAVGRSFGKNADLDTILAIKKSLAATKVAGMTVGELRGKLDEFAAENGVPLAKDITGVMGIGLDPCTYPSKDGHVIDAGMVLQVVLAVDGGSTTFASDMVLVGDAGCEFLTAADR